MAAFAGKLLPGREGRTRDPGPGLREAARHFELSHDLVCTAGFDGYLRRLNGRWEEALGWTDDELRSRPFTALVHADDLAATEAHLAKLAAGGETVLFRNRYRTKDGAWRWLEWAAVGVPDEGLIYAAARDITEPVEAEECLRVRERQLTEAQAIAHLGSWSWSIAEDRIEWSDELCRIFGLEPGSSPGDFDAYMALIHPDDVARTREVIGAAHQTGAPYEIDHRIVRPGGEVRWLNGRGRVVLGDDGRPVLIHGTAQDVTEQREAEFARREAERRFHGAFATAAIGMALVGIDGRFLQVNGALCEIVGYDPDELAQKTFQEISHPDDVDAEVAQVWRVLEGVIATYQMEKRYLHARGHEVWVRVSVSLVRSEEGEPMYFVSQIEDINEQQHARKALHTAEERFRSAFNDSAVGMALVGLAGDEEGRLLLVNRALCEITGYRPSQLQGRAFLDFVHPDHLTRTRELARQLRAGEITTMQAEVQMIGFVGALCWVAVNASLVKGMDGTPMHAVVQIQDVSERKRFEGQLQHLADHDPLTGLFNRRRFEQELEREVSAASRYGTGGAVMILDLDDFKYVNDSAGHVAGDELLSGIAATLRRRLRSSDTIARLGGDEFGVILPHVDEQRARMVAEDLRATVQEGLWSSHSEARRATVSIGVAMFANRSQELTGEDLIVEADVAMYEAKEAGRDRIRVYDPAGDRRQRMEANLRWVDRIRAALEEERFILHAQPIAPLQGGGRPHYELLVRMVEPGGDIVPPSTFLNVAERSNLIQDIDRWVIRDAIRSLAREQQRGNDVMFEVNVSAKSVGDPELPAWIAEQLEEAGADGRGLIFEMTETEAIVNIEGARTFAGRLRTLGCGFALDDFGAGFASFYYLKHLSFDYLKIDGEFIQNLPRDRTDQMVVRAVVAIARGLGKQTIAEFVGDRETLELLRELGVDFAQGYWIGRPGPLEEIEPGARAAIPA